MSRRRSFTENDIDSNHGDNRSVISRQTTPPAMSDIDEPNPPDPHTPPPDLRTQFSDPHTLLSGNMLFPVHGQLAVSDETVPTAAAGPVSVVDFQQHTPPKARTYSTEHTRDTLYVELKADLETHHYRNIDIEVFLKLCSGLDEGADIQPQLTNILKWGVHNKRKYQYSQREFQLNHNRNREASTYEHFINMGNMFLERAEKEEKSERQVRLLDHHLYNLEKGRAERRPDIVLVPKTVKERVINKRESGTIGKGKEPELRYAASVPEVLVPFEMKVNGIFKGITGTKNLGQDYQSEPLKLGKRSNMEGGTARSNKRVKTAEANFTEPPSSQDAVQPKGYDNINPEIQLASYAIELMSHRGDRSYTFGVLVKGASVTIFLYHRSAIFSSEEFNFLHRPEYLAFFLSIFTHDPSTYGFNKYMGYKDPFNLGNPSTLKVDLNWLDLEGFAKAEIPIFASGETDKQVAMELKEEDKKTDLKAGEVERMVLGEKIVCHYVIIGRGTSVINAEIASQNEIEPAKEHSTTSEIETSAPEAAESGGSGSNNLRRSSRLRNRNPMTQISTMPIAKTTTSSTASNTEGKNTYQAPAVADEASRPLVEKRKFAFKFSWQVLAQTAEVIFLLYARKRLPKHVPKVYGYAVVDDKTLARHFIAHYQTKFNKECEKYEERELRVIVMDYFEGLDALDDIEMIQYLIYQCMDCLHILYKEIGLLHRDISYGNIAFYKQNNKCYVIILDFDLAVFADNKIGITSNLRKGTVPFMSRELLNAICSSIAFTHTIKYDLESVFDLWVWVGTGYRSSWPLNKDPLKEWRKGLPKNMRTAKQTFFTDDDRAKEILEDVTNEKVQTMIGEVRRAYQIEIEAVQNEASPDSSAFKELAHEEATKAMQAFLLEHPSFNELDFEPRNVYVSKLAEIRKADPAKPVYRGISYKKIMIASGRAIISRHVGCRCC